MQPITIFFDVNRLKLCWFLHMGKAASWQINEKFYLIRFVNKVSLSLLFLKSFYGNVYGI